MDVLRKRVIVLESYLNRYFRLVVNYMYGPFYQALPVAVEILHKLLKAFLRLEFLPADFSPVPILNQFPFIGNCKKNSLVQKGQFP